MSDSAADRPALVLVGPMGAGKTSLGRKAARGLGLPFVDTDAIIVAEHGPIPDLFRAGGEAHFRAIERAAVVRALGRPGVVSLGGGSVLDADTRRDLDDLPVVLLTVPPHVVAGRIGGDDRPLLAGDDPVAQWVRIFEARRPYYDEVADLELDTSRGPMSEIAQTLVDWARSRTAAAAV